MKVPLSWLKEYLPLHQSVEEIANALTSMGLEVEGIDQRDLPFEGVVVAKILNVEPHPNADRLRVATVSDGIETLQIVCGASNCRPGIKTALAKIGAVLTDTEGKTLKIKKGKLRDVESYGMLCAADELGMAENSEGILEFSEELSEGTDLKKLYSDTIFDISLTPNLGFDLSIIGIARELAAKFELPLSFPKLAIVEDPQYSIEQSARLTIDAPELCERYACRVLRGVSVGPSPHWLKTRLEAVGQKSINNLVDIGNFVMLETGQPLHVFDLEKIEGAIIKVNQATTQGSLVLLDESTCQFPEGTLLISDAKKPLAIAGVMGGKESAVSATTSSILIESAYFSPSSIRSASKHLSLRTEAAYRFERNVDKGGVVAALDRAASLIQELAGGKADTGVLEKITKPITERLIPCRIDRLNKFLGLQLSQNEVTSLLERLYMKVRIHNSDLLQVTVPTFRNDLTIEEDLFEEVARLYGYNNIPRTPAKHISNPFNDSPIFVFEEKMRRLLVSEGLQECMHCDLISPTQALLTVEKGMGEDTLIHVLHPSSIDQSVLRPSLLPGLLQMAQFNQAHGKTDLSVFEIGKIHFRENGSFKEKMTGAIVLKGLSAPYHFYPKSRSFDFFDLKGVIENLFDILKIDEVDFKPSHLHSFHPFRQAQIHIKGKCIGTLGEIHPEKLQLLDIRDPLLFAELDLQELSHLAQKNQHCKSISPFPGSERDWTVTVKEHMPMSHLFEAIEHCKSPLLQDFYLLDLYKPEQLGEDKKNVTLRFSYLDRERTIDQATVEKEHAKLLQQVAEKIGIYVL